MTKRQAGFTLIEVMISMAILAVICILSTQTMRAGIQDRDEVANEIESDSKVADAMRIIRTDVNAAFHYRDLYVTIANNAQKPDPSTQQNGQAPAVAPPPITGAPGADPFAPAQPPAQVPGAGPAPTPRPTPADVTGFVGDAESMYFTTLSNQRTIKDSSVSDQAKVGYYVKSCKVNSGKKQVGAKCLYRSLSPYLDEEVEKPGDDQILLENVSEFKLRYLGPGRGTSTDLEYVEAWKTGKNGDAISKFNFPYAVEVTLVTENKDDKNAKKVTASALIPIRFPNNPPKNKDGTPGNGQIDATTNQSQQGGTPAGQTLNPGMTGTGIAPGGGQ